MTVPVPQQGQPYPAMAPPPEPQPTKEAPWGSDDPLLWCARRVRWHAMWGSVAIALLILMFEGGMYTLFTTAIFEGGIEGKGGLLAFLVVPFILAIVGGVAAGALAKNVGRLSRQPGAPGTARVARLVLVVSIILWVLLLVVYPLSLTVTTDPDNPDNEPFPIGIITVLPVYMGLCVAVYTTGAAYVASSLENKLESTLVILLGWAALGMFLLLPAVISSWDVGSGDPNITWDSAVWWLRFGNFFPTLVPFLIVIGLYYAHNRNIELMELEGETDAMARTAAAGARSDECPRCGGTLSVHPRTQEVFCTACGEGLATESQDLVVETPMELFVEQVPGPGPQPDHAPAPTTHQAQAGSVGRPAPAARFCSECGSEMSTLSKTGQVYCPGCGAGLPSTTQQAPDMLPAPDPAPSPSDAPPMPSTYAPSSPQAAPVQAIHPPVLTNKPARTPPKPGICTRCGGMTTIHPRTQQLFCPACGAGLSPQV